MYILYYLIEYFQDGQNGKLNFVNVFAIVEEVNQIYP